MKNLAIMADLMMSSDNG